MTRLLPALCISLGLLSGAAIADPSPLCGKSGAADWNEIREAFVGIWTIKHQSGYARMGSMLLPFPEDANVDRLTIALIGDVLEASHPDMQSPMILRFADEPRWEIDRSDAAKPAPVASPDDIAQGFGCDQLELPRVVGTATAMVDGVQMDFTYRMMATDWSTLFGVMQMKAVVHGTPVVAWRTVVMNEVE